MKKIIRFSFLSFVSFMMLIGTLLPLSASNNFIEFTDYASGVTIVTEYPDNDFTLIEKDTDHAIVYEVYNRENIMVESWEFLAPTENNMSRSGATATYTHTNKKYIGVQNGYVVSQVSMRIKRSGSFRWITSIIGSTRYVDANRWFDIINDVNDSKLLNPSSVNVYYNVRIRTIDTGAANSGYDGYQYNGFTRARTNNTNEYYYMKNIVNTYTIYV